MKAMLSDTKSKLSQNVAVTVVIVAAGLNSDAAHVVERIAQNVHDRNAIGQQRLIEGWTLQAQT
ncbi:hypothetical protein V5799_016878, partial [Amblyomma americanum]